MISNIRKGDFHLMDMNDNLFVYHKESNQIYEIDTTTFKYLNQSFTDFKYNKKIEDNICNNIKSSKEIKKSEQLVLNVFVKNIDSEAIVLKEVLTSKDNYDRIYIIFEVTDKLIILIEKLADWFDGDKKFHYIFRASEEKKYLLSHLKKLFKTHQNKKIFTFEIYKIIYNEYLEVANLSKQNIKISPFLMFEKNNNFISILKQSLFYKSLNTIYSKNYNLRSTNIITLTDNDFINSADKEESVCNSCWAKKNCYALNLYSIFSSHPLICSLSEKNCTVIRNFVEIVMKSNINQNLINRTNIVKYYVKNYELSHLNP